jgi:hypothetical protein
MSNLGFTRLMNPCGKASETSRCKTDYGAENLLLVMETFDETFGRSPPSIDRKEEKKLSKKKGEHGENTLEGGTSTTTSSLMVH